MNEGKINSLPTQNYSESPRRQLNFTGESTAIRAIDPTDKIDMSRIRTIQDTLSNSFTGTTSTDEELIEEIVDTRPGFNSTRDAVYTFGISGSEQAANSEIGELQGWINFYRDEYVPEMQEQGKIQDATNRSMVLNVAFGNLPEIRPDQMASGLRQACTYLGKVEAARHEENEINRNRTSQKIKPDITITAYAENEKEAHVFSDAGFTNEGQIALRYKPEDKVYNYNLYVLDWEKLNTIMQQNAKKAFLPRIENQ